MNGMRIERASEQAVLGHCLWTPVDAPELLRWCSPDMFAVPGHATIASLIKAMVAEGLPVDPTTVQARLASSGEDRRTLGDQPEAYLHTLLSVCAPRDLESARWHAQQVRVAHADTRLAARLTGAGEALSAGRTVLSSAVLEASQAIDEAELLGQAHGEVRVRTSEDLLATNPPVDWLIPGLLARRERVVITGTEGLGKSELEAMLAVCAAAGLHPWTGEACEPLRVLVVDCENDLDQLRRRYRRIIGAVERVADFDRSRLMVEVREAGMDLTKPDDVVWLSRLLSAAAPHLLLLGPLYKLHRSNINDEQAARGLVGALDDLRVRHDVAVITEAHPGHSDDGRGNRSMRPRGSSLFLGWPNVGFGIRPHRDAGTDWPPRQLEIVHWRGNREARAWPDGLQRMQGGDGWPVLPFAAVYAEGTHPVRSFR